MAHSISIDVICPLIAALLPRGYPAIDEVAHLLHVSQRTLQRQLHTEGVSYSELVERCRCQTACNFLEQTRQPIAEIAARLAYADPSSFTRAFRRWTGTTPRDFRAHTQGNSDVTTQILDSSNMRD